MAASGPHIKKSSCHTHRENIFCRQWSSWSTPPSPHGTNTWNCTNHSGGHALSSWGPTPKGNSGEVARGWRQHAARCAMSPKTAPLFAHHTRWGGLFHGDLDRSRGPRSLHGATAGPGGRVACHVSASPWHRWRIGHTSWRHSFRVLVARVSPVTTVTIARDFLTESYICIFRAKECFFLLLLLFPRDFNR